MRTRILLFCGVVLAVCLWLLWRQHEAPKPIASPEAVAVSTNPPPAQSQPVNPPSAPPAVAGQPPASVPQSTPKTGMELYSQMRSNLLSPERRARLEQFQEAWRTPIQFYGQVVDENTNPVAGAQVDFDCNDLSTNGTSYYHTGSDANGLFSIVGITGKLLSVHVSKEGYYSSRRDREYFDYAGNGGNNFISDAGNPVVFHLLKKKQGEHLIEKDFPPGIGQIWQLHHDGTPIELDLLNGSQNVTGSGQLKLEFWRDLSNPNAKRFDWKLQISAVGGGLVPADEEFAFTAPDTGYQPSIVIDMPATNQVWLGELRSRYYIQLPNGNYGRFDFYLLAGNGAFTVKSWVNPTGSRNLENDPGQ